MGVCCGEKNFRIENEIEKQISEALSGLRIQKYDWSKINAWLDGKIGISLLEVEDFQKWVTEDIYLEFVNQRILVTDSQELYLQEQLVPSYSQIIKQKKPSVYLVSWMLSLLKGQQKKVMLVDSIIKTDYEIVNFSTFRRFLSGYLTYNLLTITENLTNLLKNSENKADYDEIKETYTLVKLEHFLGALMNQMKNILVLKHRSIKIGNLEHEFVNIEDLTLFFKENDFVLEVLELREEFFVRYSRVP